jgi:hypothetical protein
MSWAEAAIAGEAERNRGRRPRMDGSPIGMDEQRTNKSDSGIDKHRLKSGITQKRLSIEVTAESRNSLLTSSPFSLQNACALG